MLSRFHPSGPTETSPLSLHDALPIFGRHPLAGMAACFAGVGAIFGANPIPGPIDAQITAITNEALGAAGGTPLGVRKSTRLNSSHMSITYAVSRVKKTPSAKLCASPA